MRKVFIVARERDDLYTSLCRALESEGDVLVIYDRRSGGGAGRGARGWRSLWSLSDLSPERGDRRVRADVDDAIRLRGFGVVHLDDVAVDDGGDDDLMYDEDDSAWEDDPDAD